jgi:hypothetical protein
LTGWCKFFLLTEFKSISRFAIWRLLIVEDSGQIHQATLEEARMAPSNPLMVEWRRLQPVGFHPRKNNENPQAAVPV